MYIYIYICIYVFIYIYIYIGIHCDTGHVDLLRNLAKVQRGSLPKFTLDLRSSDELCQNSPLDLRPNLACDHLVTQN